MSERRITVCSACFQASCWHGEFMCWDSGSAGTVQKTEAELDALNLEHPHHYSVENIERICNPKPRKSARESLRR